MQAQSTIDLPQELYERVHRLARHRHQPVPELLADALDLAEEQQMIDSHFAQTSEAEIVDWSEPDEAVDREMQAYIAMHPQLKKQFLGKHVAIYGGELVDMDDNFEALYTRIDAKFPLEFVWLTPVEEEAIPTLVVHSPRFVME